MILVQLSSSDGERYAILANQISLVRRSGDEVEIFLIGVEESKTIPCANEAAANQLVDQIGDAMKLL